MVKWTKKEGIDSLGAVSTMKRALGIPNHPTLNDEILDGKCHIYTPDEGSAQLIAELMYKWANGGRSLYYDAHGSSLRDTIKVHPLDSGGFQTSINMIYAPSFTKGILKMVEKHVSPDTRFR